MLAPLEKAVWAPLKYPDSIWPCLGCGCYRHSRGAYTVRRTYTVPLHRACIFFQDLALSSLFWHENNLFKLGSRPLNMAAALPRGKFQFPIYPKWSKGHLGAPRTAVWWINNLFKFETVQFDKGNIQTLHPKTCDNHIWRVFLHSFESYQTCLNYHSSIPESQNSYCWCFQNPNQNLALVSSPKILKNMHWKNPKTTFQLHLPTPTKNLRNKNPPLRWTV